MDDILKQKSALRAQQGALLMAKTFGQLLSAARQKAGMSLKELGSHIGQGAPEILRAEQGKRVAFSTHDAARLEIALGMKSGRLQRVAAEERGELSLMGILSPYWSRLIEASILARRGDLKSQGQIAAEAVGVDMLASYKDGYAAALVDVGIHERTEDGTACTVDLSPGNSILAMRQPAKTHAEARRARLDAGMCRDCDSPRAVKDGKVNAQWCPKHLERQRKYDAASWKKRNGKEVSR